MSERRVLAGRKVRPIGLGCMSLSHAYGVSPSVEDAAQLLNRALDIGYDHLDTARIYGAGKNEELIGHALKGRRREFLLASKAGILIDGATRRIDCSPEAIRREVETSLRLLHTDHIDLYYLHRRDFQVPIEDSIGAMSGLVREGKIGAIGLSEMSAETLRRAHAIHPIAAMQTEYSLWTRNVEIAVLEATRQLGVALVAFSPLARGVLAGGLRDPARLTEGDLRRAMPRFGKENWASNLALVDRFNAIAAGQGVTPAQLSLAWVLSRGAHIHAIPGTARPDHLEENFARTDWHPEPAVLDRLDALINAKTVAGPRYGEAMQRTIDTEEFVDDHVTASATVDSNPRFKFNLRGWALYQFVRLLTPNLADPKVLAETIRKDRVHGPHLPPKKLLASLDVSETEENGMRVFRARRKGAPVSASKLLFLHGGAYVLNLQKIHWGLIAGLLDRVDAEVIAPIYPLGPEADWKATTSAIRNYFQVLAGQYGAENIVVCGDSSGGGLALILAQAMRDEGLPQPRALVLFSPALDLSGSGPDQPALERRDPALSLQMLKEIGPMWLKGLSPEDPRVSPLFASQDRLPPTIVFTGDREILHSDGLRLKMRNPSIVHRGYREMMHVFPVGPLREARQALDEAAAFILRQ